MLTSRVSRLSAKSHLVPYRALYGDRVDTLDILDINSIRREKAIYGYFHFKVTNENSKKTQKNEK